MSLSNPSASRDKFILHLMHFALSALHSSLNKMFCWLERKLFDPFNGHLSSDKLHLHSVKSLKFPFFSPVANWRRSPLITSFLTGHVTRSSQEWNVSSGFFMAPWRALGVTMSIFPCLQSKVLSSSISQAYSDSLRYTLIGLQFLFLSLENDELNISRRFNHQHPRSFV